jgi:hypothetical protein
MAMRCQNEAIAGDLRAPTSSIAAARAGYVSASSRPVVLVMNSVMTGQ